MLKKKNVIFIIVGVVVLAMAVYYISTRVYSICGNKIVSVNINNHTLHVETVLSDEKLRKGLGGRGGMCVSCGMLFEFPKAGKYSFWMKDMRFPLDLVWILQGRVVHIEKNVQPDFIGILTPPGLADRVLELNAGSVDKFGIKIGDIVIF